MLVAKPFARGLNPLKVPLVVLSEAENTNGGLILATSPEAKHLFHLKANVSRKRDLPNDPRLWVVPPRMNLGCKLIPETTFKRGYNE